MVDSHEDSFDATGLVSSGKSKGPFRCKDGIYNTWRTRQNGRYFPDDIFEGIFVNENVLLSIEISLKFVPKSPINNIPALMQIMAWHRPDDKPLSEPMMVSLLYPPYPKDRGMLWFYVKAARRPPPVARRPPPAARRPQWC